MPKPCGGHSPWLDVGVAVTSGDDQDHPTAEGTMVLILSAVVPWAFQNAKARQGIDQNAGAARCSLANTLGPFLHTPVPGLPEALLGDRFAADRGCGSCLGLGCPYLLQSYRELCLLG